MSSSGKWSRSGVPHIGWTCIEIEDLGEPSRICEMCEQQEIRYVHYMQHADYDAVLACGCDCAAQMEGNYIAAEARDKKMRGRARRKKAWPNLSAWCRSDRGNLTLQKDGFQITVFRRGAVFKAVVSNRELNFKRWSRRDYPTESDVQMASFEVFAAASE